MSDCPTDTPKSVHASITSFRAWTDLGVSVGQSDISASTYFRFSNFYFDY